MRSVRFPAPVLTIAALTACGSGDPPDDAVPAQDPELLDAWQVVPGDGLPPEVVPQPANNNLSITWHDDRLYLAFRTAPEHFASDQVEMYVVSTTDELAWRYEGRFFMETDLREPHLVSWNGALHLYFAVLGSDPSKFEPQGSRHAVYQGPDQWTEPEPMFPDDFIPWRIKEIGGRLHTTGYTGGGGVYEPGSADAIKVRWLASDDGLTWTAAVDGHEIVHEGGTSETDLVVRDDGSVIAVMRNEAGDEDGFGSKICRGAPEAPATWTCAADPKKYDSPLVFQRDGRVWLVGRRNLTEDGAYDLGRDDLSAEEQYFLYQVTYWQEPKRCALWEVDPDALTVRWVLDLPSKGDTCFPEAVDLDGDVLLYNYSSDPDGPELSWLEGQKGETGIFRQILRF